MVERGVHVVGLALLVHVDLVNVLAARMCCRAAAARGEARRMVRAMLGSDRTNRPEGW